MRNAVSAQARWGARTLNLLRLNSNQDKRSLVPSASHFGGAAKGRVERWTQAVMLLDNAETADETSLGTELATMGVWDDVAAVADLGQLRWLHKQMLFLERKSTSG